MQAAHNAEVHAAAVADAETAGAHKATAAMREELKAAVAQAHAHAEESWLAREQQLIHEVALATHAFDEKFDRAALFVTTSALAEEVRALEAVLESERRLSAAALEDVQRARDAALSEVRAAERAAGAARSLAEARGQALAAAAAPTSAQPAANHSVGTSTVSRVDEVRALRSELDRALSLLEGKGRSEAYLRQQLALQEAATDEATSKAQAFREALEVAQMVRGAAAPPMSPPVASWVVPKASGAAEPGGLLELLFERQAAGTQSAAWRRGC